MIYVICYDLNKEDKDYPDLWDALAAYPFSKRVQQSVWVISCSQKTFEVFAELFAHIDDDDMLLVVQEADIEGYNLPESVRVLIEGMKRVREANK